MFDYKKITFGIFILLILQGGALLGLESRTNPDKMVEPGFGEWHDHYFTFSEKGNLILRRLSQEGFTEQTVYTFPLEPERVKHFRLKDVAIFAAWNNAVHSLVIVILDREWKPIRVETHKLRRTLSDLDLRVDPAKRIVISMVEFENGHNYLTLKFDGRTHELTIQENPIQATMFNWPKYTVHYIYKEEVQTHWSVWEKGHFFSYILPFPLGAAAFVKHKGEVYLFGTDANNHLYLFTIGPKGEVKPFRLFTNREGVPVDKISVTRIGKGLQVFLISSKSKLLFQFGVDPAFPAGELSPAKRGLLTESDVYLGELRGQTVWLEVTQIGHQYMRYWEDSFVPVEGFHWKIDIQGGVTTLYLSWESSASASYEYRYIFDQNRTSKPLPDYNDLPRRTVTFTLREEGDYVFHLQGRDKSTGRESPVYHIPVFYRFTPPEPEVSLLNEISPRVITGRRLEFLIQNYGPYTYYAEINKIPVKEPAQKIKNSGGYGRISHRFEAGRYYLHLRCRDERTGRFSPTLHHLFFYETMAIEQAVGVEEYNKNMSELREILRMMEKTRYDREENEKWRKKLKELREKLNQETVHSTK